MEHVTSATNFGATVHSIKQSHTEGPLGKAISAAAHEKNAVKRAEFSPQETTISASENPTELLFKASVESINEVLGGNVLLHC